MSSTAIKSRTASCFGWLGLRRRRKNFVRFLFRFEAVKNCLNRKPGSFRKMLESLSLILEIFVEKRLNNRQQRSTSQAHAVSSWS